MFWRSKLPEGLGRLHITISDLEIIPIEPIAKLTVCDNIAISKITS